MISLVLRKNMPSQSDLMPSKILVDSGGIEVVCVAETM